MFHNGPVAYLAAGLLAYLPVWLAAPYRPDAALYLAALAPPFLLLFLCRRAAVGGRLGTQWLLALGLAVRIGFLFQPPSLSEDVYRYLWDGALVVGGESPFAEAPRDLTAARAERAGLYSRMAHRDRATVYPPLAQTAFAASWVLWKDSAVGWRLLLLLGEAGLVAVLVAGFRTPPGRLSLWLLHPLVVVEFYSSGHLDLLALALLAGALLVLAKPGGRMPALGSALVAAASLVKVFPAFFMPLAFRLRGWRRAGSMSAAFLAAAALLSLPLLLWTGSPLDSARSLASAISGFHAEWRFNSLPFSLLAAHRLGAGLVASALFAAAVAALAAGRTVAPERSGFEDFLTRCYFLLAVFYALAHTVHPWYTTWILLFYPLLGLRYRAGYWLASVCSLSYLAYGSDPPREWLWVLLFQYIPYYLLLLLDFGAYHRGENGRQAIPRDHQAGW